MIERRSDAPERRYGAPELFFVQGKRRSLFRFAWCKGNDGLRYIFLGVGGRCLFYFFLGVEVMAFFTFVLVSGIR